MLNIIGFKRTIRLLLDLPIFISALFIFPLNIMLYQFYSRVKRSKNKPKLVFGTAPIISLAYIAASLRQLGYRADVVVSGESSIYPRSTFDVVLAPKFKRLGFLRHMVWQFNAYYFFSKALWTYDIFHYYFDGGLLKNTWMNRFELLILKLSRKKIILLPYGSDAFVYDQIPNPIWRHGLMIEYAQFGNQAQQIQNKIRRMTSYSDIVIACLVHFINLPRWDILPLTCYPIDLMRLQPLYPRLHDKPIRIAHASNHRGIKGTVFLIAAVENLKKLGVQIHLDVIEKTPNEDALKRIGLCDIYVDQLIFGYAQAALEAMALGKVVISALDQSPAYELFRQFSYLNECPIICSNTSNIQTVLTNLIDQRETWNSLGRKNRAYAEKRHSFEACGQMYEAIYQKIWWNVDINLLNFYHPLLERQHENTPSTL